MDSHGQRLLAVVFLYIINNIYKEEELIRNKSNLN